MPTDEEVVAAFREVRSWKQGDQRAPHKPLLLLLALATMLRIQLAPRALSENRAVAEVA